jgi:hypothetical protein
MTAQGRRTVEILAVIANGPQDPFEIAAVAPPRAGDVLVHPRSVEPILSMREIVSVAT